MSAPGYRSYRESVVDWNVRVPTHWTDTRLRFVARFNPSKSEVAARDRHEEVSFLPMDAVGDDGTIRLDQTREVGDVETGYTYFADGDVTYAKITPCFENGKGAVMRGLKGGIGFGTTELTVARPTAGNSAEFLHWLFTSAPFRKLGEGSMYGAGGQKRVPDDFARDFRLALPSVDEQAAIAAFLDRETGKIDALVEAQRRLIELLKEKRQAVISHAVTKGLDPAAPTKNSGVEWLGDVPAHWEVSRLANLFREIIEPGDDSLPVLSVSIHNGVSDDEAAPDQSERKVTRSEDRTKYKRVQPNDLVYNMMRAWQGGFGTVQVTGAVSPAYVVARPSRPEIARFVELLLRTPKAVEEMRRRSRGVTDFRLRLYWDEFKDMGVAVPAVEEVCQILWVIADKSTRWEQLIEEAEAAIGLLQERRSALVSAAVTGKFDVRGVVPNISEAA